MSDRTNVGLYFAMPPARGVRALQLAPEAGAAEPAGRGLSFTRTVAEGLQAVAVYPDRALESWNVDVRATRPDGSVAELIRLRPRHADWVRRYWFAKPIALPRGTQIDVAATPRGAALAPDAAPGAPPPADPASLRLTLNVVSAN